MTLARPSILRTRALVAAAAALATAGLLAALASPPATADGDAPAGRAAADGPVVSTSMADPDDTDGPLDISRVADRVYELDRDHARVYYRVRTWAGFATELLAPHKRYFILYLNTDGEPGSEREVVISSRDGRLVADIISPATRQVVGTAEVSRPTDQSIEVNGPRHVLGARSYFWASNFHSRRSAACGRGDGFPIVCQDDVPEGSWLRLQRPAWPDRS